MKPPYSPQSVVSEFARTLKSYGVSEVSGDGYSGQFVRELFRNQGIAYTVSKRTKSEIYIDLLPALNSGRIELLDDVKLIAQLVGLERKPGRGRDVIDHAPHSHDDFINVAAGALTLAALQPAQMVFCAPIVGPSKASYAAEYARGILADRSSGVPGIASAYGDCGSGAAGRMAHGLAGSWRARPSIRMVLHRQSAQEETDMGESQDAQKVLSDLETKLADNKAWQARNRDGEQETSFRGAYGGRRSARASLTASMTQRIAAEQEAGSIEIAIAEAKQRLQARDAAELTRRNDRKRRARLLLLSAFEVRGEALARDRLTKFLAQYADLSKDFHAA